MKPETRCGQGKVESTPRPGFKDSRNPFLTPLLRRLYFFVACVFVAYGAVYLAERSPWNKERLYQKVVTGDRQHKIRAAARLVVVGGQKQLLRALRSRSEEVRDVAGKALWELWFRAAGQRAYVLANAANEAMNRNELSEALNILDRVVERYPFFAEGWNRRALLYWQTGHYARSISDCRRVVSLNPDHFGAWQGMGMCQVHLGDYQGACRSFAAALRLTPHDKDLRRILARCQDMRQQEDRRPRPGIEFI